MKLLKLNKCIRPNSMKLLKKKEMTLKFNESWTALSLGVAQFIQEIKHWTLNIENLE